MKSIISLITICFILLCSCEQVQLKIADSNVPVVESYLNPGQNISVKLVKQLVYSSNDSVNEYLDNLNVAITVLDSIILLVNTGDGLYENAEFQLQPLKEYNLSFIYNDKQVNAKTNIPEKPKDFIASSPTFVLFETELELSWHNPDGDYYLVVVENMEEETNPINETISTLPKVFRTNPLRGNGLVLNTRNFTYYGKHRIILFRINEEYAELYEQLGTSSLDIQAPPSNVVNGLGIFTGINSDTLFVNVVSQ